MKKSRIKESFYFSVPYLFSIAFFLFQLSQNFKVNGGDFEFFVSDFFLLSVTVIFIQIFFYFLLRRFIKNNKVLYILEILIFFLLFNHSIILLLVIGIVVVFSFIYRDDNNYINKFIDIFYELLCLIVIFFLLFNISVIYRAVLFRVRYRTFDNNKKIIIDKKSDLPNIYWIHMDGMPNTNFIKKYYGNNLEEFNSYLSDYYVNEKASFKGGHHTMMSLVALFNPNYYDGFYYKYLNDLDYCELNKCITKDTVSFKELTYKRLNNELFKSLKMVNYKTVCITEFNQYTSFNTDYIYDIDHIDETNKIAYLSNNYSSDDLYKYTVYTHRYGIFRNVFDIKMNKNNISDELLDYNLNNIKYKYLNDTKYIQMKAFIKGIEDVNSKDNNPKFYFFDNGINHLYWNYDKNGNKIGIKNTDLADFDDNYIYSTKLLMDFLQYIRDNDPDGVIIVQGDHGIHALNKDTMKEFFEISDEEVLNIRNSTFNAVYIPESYRNGDEKYLNNPLNISRYLVNNFVGKNYKYLK